jgi:lambda family phage minor tail protein L
MTLPAEYLETKNAQTNQPINLYTLEDYDGLGTNLNFAEWKVDVVFDGVTYTHFPMARDASTENVQGEIDAVKISMANVSRLLQYYLENYDLRGKKLTIRQVWADQLTDIDNVRTEVFYIDRYTASDKAVNFECSSKFDVQEVELPFGRYMRGVCRWKSFKDANCAYAGAYTSCNRTMADCRIRGNIIRFGAFPSIPSQRTVVA